MHSHQSDSDSSDSSMDHPPLSFKCDSNDLRIVLLGVSGAGKSSLGNEILGRKAFKKSRTRESEIQRGKVEDRNISIIDTPGFFNDQLNDEEMKKQMIKSLELSDPGPHVFLLIVNLENFERNIVEKIKEIFRTQALMYTMVLVIEKKQKSKKKKYYSIHSADFKDLVSNFSGQHHEINSTDRTNKNHIKKLLMEIDEFIKQKNGQYCNNKICSVSQGSTKKEKKLKQRKVEKKYRKKEQEQETVDVQMNTAMKEGATHAVFEPENVRQRKKTTDTETNLQGRNSLDRGVIFPSQEKQQTIEEKHPTKAGGSRLAVCLGILCVLLLVTFAQQDITITELRDQLKSYENTVEELTQTINSLQDNFTDVTTEKDLCHQLTKRIVMSDLRIMVVGKTGAGKSASGNTILGENVFEEKMSSESVTKTCQEHRRKVKGGSISVTDTPGLFDTKNSKEQLKDEIEKCVNMSVPGPHAFLLVIRLDVRFTDEEKKTIKWIQDNFGEKAADHSIILFTRGDQIDKPIEEFLNGNRQIEELVRQCKSRYHVFNNQDKNPSQVNELLDKIVSMVMENGGGHYTNEMYKEALKKQKDEDERRKLEEHENMFKEALNKQREDDERWRLEKEENMRKESQKRQREDDERQRLEKEENMLKESQKRQRVDDKKRRFKNTNDKKSAFFSMAEFFSSFCRFIMDWIKKIFSFII